MAFTNHPSLSNCVEFIEAIILSAQRCVKRPKNRVAFFEVPATVGSDLEHIVILHVYFLHSVNIVRLIPDCSEFRSIGNNTASPRNEKGISIRKTTVPKDAIGVH